MQDSVPVVDQQLLYTCCPYIGEDGLSHVPRAALPSGTLRRIPIAW